MEHRQNAEASCLTRMEAERSYIPTQLHHLPGDFRVVFKILLITYKALNGQFPV